MESGRGIVLYFSVKLSKRFWIKTQRKPSGFDPRAGHEKRGGKPAPETTGANAPTKD